MPRSILLPLLCLPFLCLAPSLLAQTPMPPSKKLFLKNPMDAHSYSNPQIVRVTHVALDLTADFSKKVLVGTATLDLARTQPGDLVLDTRDLTINAVEVSVDGTKFVPAKFSLGPSEPYLGQPLSISTPDDVAKVRVSYQTSPYAVGLQWLTPPQTAGKRQPFLFTQSEPTYARTWIPLQDSPSVRVTYAATIHVPKALRAVMSAQQDLKAPLTGTFRFKLEQPVAPYLIALGVGDLVFQSTGPRTGIFADPTVVKKAAKEFEDTEKMVQAVEKLYGPYRWGRYDLLILPPSFPYGGMENPLLTFATPTVIAGDKSLVALVAHELSHSWSGNLVTNASWRDFWLNEGFTTYVENRVQEVLFGKERADMEFALDCNTLKKLVDELPPQDQILHINLTGRDPEDGQTEVPYYKGALLLKLLEKTYGRDQFDTWLKSYFEKFAFQSITTAQFREHVTANLINLDAEKGKLIDLDAWIEEPGLPANAPLVVSKRLDAVDAALAKYVAGGSAKEIDTSQWVTQEWVRFLTGLAGSANPTRLQELDQTLGIDKRENVEIRLRWLLLVVEAQYKPSYPTLAKFLQTVGRRRLIVPLYTALLKTPDGKDFAKTVYGKARSGYHPIAQATIDGLLK